MQKVDYKYYLVNGECIEYSLLSDSNLVSVIDGIVTLYATLSPSQLPTIVRVSTDIAALLNRELAQRYSFTPTSPNPGQHLMRLHTMVGPVDIIPVLGLEYPIFYGSIQEYEDNSFNLPMEEILGE